MVEFLDPITNKNLSYYIDKKLLKNLDKIKDKLKKQDKDFVLIVDGPEGSGKSVFSMQIGKCVDPTLDLSRICMNAEEFKQAIIHAKKSQCVIYDEAFTGLSSRSSLSEINRALVSLMMQMRQKNLFVIVALPSFFMLDKYVALFRARALFHIFEKKEKRYFMGFNRNNKKNLHLTGAKTYSYGKIAKRLKFKGRFFGKYIVDEQKYRDKKREALEKVEEDHGKVDRFAQRNKIIYQIYNKPEIYSKNNKKSFRELSKWLKEANVPLTFQHLSGICGKKMEKQAFVASPTS